MKQWETLRHRPAPKAEVELRTAEEEAAIQQRKRTGAWYDYSKPCSYLERQRRDKRRFYTLVILGLVILAILVVVNMLRLA